MPSSCASVVRGDRAAGATGRAEVARVVNVTSVVLAGAVDQRCRRQRAGCRPRRAASAAPGRGSRRWPSKLGSATMRQYADIGSAPGRPGSGSSRCEARLHRHERIDAHPAVVVRGEVDDAARAEPRDQRTDAIAATTTAAVATRRAPRPAATSSLARTARTGPDRPPALHAAERVGEQQRERAARGTAAPYSGLMNSSRTESANATSATGGRSASSGLPARNASACAENTAAHIAAIAGEHQRGQRGRGRDLDAGLLADPARGLEGGARGSRGSGRPCQVVSGNTRSPIATTSALAADERREQQVAPFEQRRDHRRGQRRRPSAAAWGRGPRTRVRTRTPWRSRPARSRRRRSDAVHEPTFLGCVPSFLQARGGGQDDAVPSGAGRGRGEPAWPGPPAALPLRRQRAGSTG